MHSFQYRESSVNNKRSYLLLVADIFLVYTMLAPYILRSIVYYTGIGPNFIRTFCILLGPGVLSLLLYLKIFGARVFVENKIIVALFALFSISFFISVSGHLEIELARERLIYFVVYCMFGFVLATVAMFSVYRGKRLLRIFLVFIFFSLLYSLYVLYPSWPDIKRFSFPGINISHTARILFFFAVVCLSCLIFEKKKAIKPIVLFLFIFILVLGCYTGSKSAAISFFISLFLFVFHYSHINSNRLIRFLFPAFIILIIFLFAVLPNKMIKSRMHEGAAEFKLITEYLITGNPVAYAKVRRLQLWDQAYTRFKENPVFGAGYKEFYYVTRSKDSKVLINRFKHIKKDSEKKILKEKILKLKRKQRRSHPHNIVIELFAETGIIGFIFFFVFFLSIFRKSFNLYKNMDDCQKLLFFFFPLCLVFFFLFSIFHTNLSTAYFKWYFAGMITGFSINAQGNQLIED